MSVRPVWRGVGAAVAVVLASGALTACSDGPSEPAPGEARLLDRSGAVQVSTDGRTWTRASGDTLRRGDRVRVRGDGRAVLALADGARAELRDGSQVGIGRPLRLVAGDLLVRGGEDAPVAVDASSARASVAAGGDARFERGLAFDTAVYEGTVDLRSGSRTFRVRALRQVSVPGLGLLPDEDEPALPLRYRPDDPWDREFLGEWMAFGNDLEARSNGLSIQVGRDQGRTAGFYRLLLPALDGEPAFTQDLVDATEALAPGERLVGAAIAVAGTRAGSFAERWRSVFEFRGDGAAWGLVALDQRVRDRPRLVTDIDAALSRVVTRPDVAAAAAEPPATGGPGSSQGSTPSSAPGAPDTTAPPTSAGSPPTTSPPPPTTQPPLVPVLPLPALPPPSDQPPVEPQDEPAPIGGGVLDQLADPLVETVEGLLGGLQPPSP